MKRILSLVALLSVSANATEYKMFYLSSGKPVDVMQAITDSMNGKEVMKCQTVKASASKSGTSLSLKAVKKPKLETVLR